MRLTREEYRRGILFWNMDAKATFRTSTATAPNESPKWSEPLTDPDGSRVHSPPGRYVKLSCDVGDLSATRRPFLVRWEREFNDAAATVVWDSSSSQPCRKLMHVPNYGKFHRLVVGTPYLAWAEDAVIRVGDVAIRFVQGTVQGEKVEPLDQVEVEEGKVSITGQPTGSAEAEGRFVEIVAPGESREAAEQLAYSILGLLALCMGDHVAGEIVFSESYDASPRGQFGRLRIPVAARMPRQAELAELDAVDLILPLLLGGERSARARTLALRWYERGIRATNPLDELLAYFLGIEVIANAYAADHGPVAEAIDRRARFDLLLQRLSDEFDNATLGLVAQRLVQPTLTERFKFYVARHRWDEALVEQFRHLAEIRNDALHGDPVPADEAEATQARDILLRLLKSELGLIGEMPWEKIPQVTALAIEYELLLGDHEAPKTA